MTNHPAIRSFADVMALWPTDAEFARDIGIKPSHAQVMKLRGSIPPHYWPRIVAAAQQRAIPGVTLELLTGLAVAKAEQSAGAA